MHTRRMKTKADLVRTIAFETGQTQKAVLEIVDALLNNVKKELSYGYRVQLIDFGTFEVRERAKRMGRNPQTGESMEYKPSKNVGFKAGKALKEAVR